MMPPMRQLEEYEVLGTCEDCGDADVVLDKDTNRCENCAGQYTFCTICEWEQHRDSLCRHVFETECGEFAGSGAGDFAETVKDGFVFLLGHMHPFFAGDLRAAILSGRFYTFACLPMIGGGGSLELHGIPDLPFPQGLKPYYNLFFWGVYLMELGSGEDAEHAADGYHWVVSLYKDKTPEANRITVAWIDEWLAARVSRLLEEAWT